VRSLIERDEGTKIASTVCAGLKARGQKAGVQEAISTSLESKKQQSKARER